MKILEVENLNVSLGGFPILENLAFDIEEGDALTIIGPNGSGKTVLLKTLLGLIPYQGKVTWKKDIKMGYLPQTLFLDQSLPLTLREFLMSKINVSKSNPAGLEEVLNLVRLPKNS
ncbi:MAG: ATP-binding cassette domain-containing protein, partial [bacterium]|nr:ATP-binding cassette domain-containing protein [bacterium]